MKKFQKNSLLPILFIFFGLFCIAQESIKAEWFKGYIRDSTDKIISIETVKSPELTVSINHTTKTVTENGKTYPLVEAGEMLLKKV